MPRMQTPRGYYSASETKDVLNISDAMVRQYVQKGRIKYFVPEGRKQGFYLKRDVDKLADELNAYLNTEPEHIKATFTKASKRDLAEVEKIAMTLFAPNATDENVTNANDWRGMVYRINPEAQYVVKDNENVVVGYVSLLPLKPDTDKINKLLSVDLISEANLQSQDIATFEINKHIILYLGAIGVKSDIDEHRKHYYGAKLISGIAQFIVELGERGVIIDKLAAVGATHNGRRILQSYGFYEIPSLKEGVRAFIMDIQGSGSPTAMSYKRALKESQELINRA